MDEMLFQLQDGRLVMEQSISDKLFLIKKRQPERSSHTSATGYSWDEAGMAELFAECYEADTRFCPEHKCWYTYANGAWRKDVGSVLVADKIREFYRIMALYCGEIADEEIRKEYLKFISKMGDRRFRDRLMKDATSVNPINAEMFDANPYLINCRNGTFDLKTMKFREHDWHDYLTMQTAFDYTNKSVKCKRWETFIKEVTQGDKVKADYLQKAIGYSMFGVAKEECMFILHGKTTRNGKSTMLATIHHLLGDYASVSPVSIICKSSKATDAESANPMLASLKGKRFVTMAESNQYGKLDEETIKQLTGGEEIKARNLYESATTFVPQFTMWLSCNDLPAVNDHSLFQSDRLRIIEFNRHFTQAEQDKNLKTEFQTQEAMQGIFSWMLAGYFRYLKDGLEMPQEIRNVVIAYAMDNDIVCQFLIECTQKSDEDTRAKRLYDAYKMWCKNCGYYTVSLKKFYAEMDRHAEYHQGRKLRDGYPVYKQIELKPM